MLGFVIETRNLGYYMIWHNNFYEKPQEVDIYMPSINVTF
jgi:hypothetical protein